MGFFTLKSSHTLFLIIFGLMLGAFGTYTYYPEYFQYSAYIAVFGILLLVFGLYLNAIIQGPRYPHIEESIYDSKTHVAYAIKDVYVDRPPDPAKKILDVYSLMEQDKKLQDIPWYLGARWWYPYLLFSHWGIDFGDFHDIKMHIYIFPHPFENFVKFSRREDGAYLMGEVYSHGSSTHLDTILAPFKVDYFGVDIPVRLGVLSTYTIEKITQDWPQAENELARLLSDFPALIEQEKANIFPLKQIEEMTVAVLPEKIRDKMKVAPRAK